MTTYDDLQTALDDVEQKTLRVTPGPWHRVNTVVMTKLPKPVTGVPQLPMRLEERAVPDENFWDDVTMTEVHVLDSTPKGTGYVAHSEREEDAAHMARCDREFVLWLIEDFRKILEEHHPGRLHELRCAREGDFWPCDAAKRVQQFVAQFNME